MTEVLEIFDDVSNPLDSVEEVLGGHDWVFERAHDDELVVHVSSGKNTYRLTFVWQEEYSAMQFYCEMDIRLPEERMPEVCGTLKNINEQLWLGHFDIPDDTRIPVFRHTCLFRGCTQTSGAEHVQDLVEIALSESERYHNAFAMLASPRYLTDDILAIVMTDSCGTA